MQHTPHNLRPPISPHVIAGLVVLGLVPIIGAGAWLWLQWNALPFLVQSTLRILVFAIPIGAATAGAYVVLMIAWRRWADYRYIDAYHVEQLTRAQQQAFPAGLQSLSFHDSSKQLPAPDPQLLLDAPTSEPTTSVPTFGNLLDAGQIGPGRPLLIGFDAATGQALTGSWNDLYSCGVGGMTGSGKSWAVAFLAGQSAAAGARIILVDPHEGDPESLSNRLSGLSASYMCEVASSTQDIEAALKLAAAKLDNRKAGKGGSWPILLICDEWTSLLRGRLGNLLTATALDIAEQGRKYGVFAILAAQAWQVDAAGAVRDRLASHYVLRTRGDQFRYQTGLRAASAPDDTLMLAAGQAYMLNVKGDLLKVQIPQMTPADLLRLGALIDRPAAAVAQPFGFTPAHAPTIAAEVNRKPDGSQMEATINLASSAAPTAKLTSPEATHAAGLFLGGKSPAEIVLELRGVKSSDGGRRYQTALREIEQLIREGIGR